MTYLLVCLSPLLACEPHEGSDTVVFTDLPPVPGMLPAHSRPFVNIHLTT